METIMQYLHNYFYKFKEKGTFKIQFGTITRDGENLKGKYVNGQYIRIVGSAVNDGVYRIASCGIEGINGITVNGCLSDEEFEGYICSLSVPREFIGLSDAIQDYNREHKVSDVVSESFGGYSYTRATSSDGSTGWSVAFSNQLKPYRRMTDGFQWVKEIK